ncbi:MAG: DoxX family protein [Pseudomonadota bacterium]
MFSVKQTINNLVAQPQLNALLAVSSRALMALIFIGAGYSKLTGYAGTQSYMEAMNVPGALLPLVIALELGGGIALLLGLQTRLVAGLLAGFTIMTGFIFHGGADQMNQIMLMKNFAIAGGLLAFVRTGAGAPAIDKD